MTTTEKVNVTRHVSEPMSNKPKLQQQTSLMSDIDEQCIDRNIMMISDELHVLDNTAKWEQLEPENIITQRTSNISEIDENDMNLLNDTMIEVLRIPSNMIQNSI